MKFKTTYFENSLSIEKKRKGLIYNANISFETVETGVYEDNPHGPNHVSSCSVEEYLLQESENAKRVISIIKSEFGQKALDIISEFLKKQSIEI